MAEEAKSERRERAAAKVKGAVEALREEAQERGFFGERPAGPGPDEYALTSGPDSPSALESIVASKRADIEALEATGEEA